MSRAASESPGTRPGSLARRSGARVITMDRGFALCLRGMEIDVFCPLIEA